MGRSQILLSNIQVKYVPTEEPSLDVFYRKWNYDGASAEIVLDGKAIEVRLVSN